jgi:carboxylate-amine ligase
MLMPTAAHPFMNPDTDTKLWPHDNNEIYAIYDRIFNCKGHGWSNLQSTHLNLPFYDDEEFAKLHAAIRIVLPILPALCASSPMLDQKLTGKLDTRLEYYKTNQSRIPSITGRVIPEAAFSKRNYTNTIYEKIKADIAPFDPENILNPIWVNSRGAMPRFDRGSIEIRVMDVQECPTADLAIIAFVIELIKTLVNEKFESEEKQMKLKTDALVSIFDQTIITGQKTVIENLDYLNAFGLTKATTANDLLKYLVEKLSSGVIDKWKPELNTILTDGNLSERIVKALNGNTSHESIQKVYRQLCGCLSQNKMFIV